MFTDGIDRDSIVLKDGKVIHFRHNDNDVPHFKVNDEKGSIYITSNKKRENGEGSEEEIIVMSGKNGSWTITPSAGSKQHVYVHSGTDSKDEKTVKHVLVTSSSNEEAAWEEKEGKKMIIVNDSRTMPEEKTIHVTVGSHDADNANDMTKYIIASDGIVVTVESDDEAKAKEIINMIENKLDAKSDAKSNNKKTEKK
jgi:hypothetical protein